MIETELQAALDLKSSQCDSARERITILETQLARRESQIAKQESQLKTVKEEYEEKLKAVEAKYSAQKAIVLKLEESILDLYKNRSAVNLSTNLPESEKTGTNHLYINKTVKHIMLNIHIVYVFL